MNSTASLSQTIQKTTRPSPVLWVILQDTTLRNRFKNLIKKDILLDHLLMSMLTDTQIKISRLRLDSIHKIGNIASSHLIHEHPPS